MIFWQDTLYLHYGKQYLKDCYIEGSVDFIFGNSTALLEHCHIHCKSAGFITAQSRKSSQETTGYVFLRCVIGHFFSLCFSGQVLNLNKFRCFDYYNLFFSGLFSWIWSDHFSQKITCIKIGSLSVFFQSNMGFPWSMQMCDHWQWRNSLCIPRTTMGTFWESRVRIHIYGWMHQTRGLE